MANLSDHGPWQFLADSGELQDLGYSGYLIISLYMTVTGSSSVIGNIFVCYVILSKAKLRVKPHNMLIVNMALSDLAISTLAHPFYTISGYHQRYLFGWTMCISQGFLSMLFAIVTMNTLCAISVYRYIAVCHPRYNCILTPRVTLRVILGLWSYSLFWTVPPLLGWNSYTIEPFGTSCSMNWVSGALPDVVYIYFLIICVYVANLVVMVCSYASVSKEAYLVRTRPHMVLDVEQARMYHRMTVNISVTWMCLTMVVVFISIWTPYILVSLWSVNHRHHMTAWTITIPSMLTKLACMLNPIVYVISKRQFRNTWKDFFGEKCNRVCPVDAPQTSLRAEYTIDRTRDGIYIGTKQVVTSSSSCSSSVGLRPDFYSVHVSPSLSGYYARLK